jgi:hypothetical protein
MAYPRSIEEFKAVLQGGGVRPTMFQVEMSFPDAVVVDQLSQLMKVLTSSKHLTFQHLMLDKSLFLSVDVN